MDKDYDIIINKLADIRDEILEESDFISKEGYDLLSNCVASPYECLCVIEDTLVEHKRIIEEMRRLLK